MKFKFITLVLICFSTFINAQNKSFDADWKKVENLENKGLTKSASKLVDEIYDRAVEEKNAVQRIKAVIYQSKYLQILEEDSQLKIVTNFKSEIENSDKVIKHLLQNLLAKLYWQYFQQNRYKFYNRAKTAEKPSDDFRTWDLETLFAEVHHYYQASLQDGIMLQNEPLEKYNILLETHKNSKDYRPTLFDFLSYNALEFYKTPENNITQPAYKFTIDNADYSAISSKFIDLNIQSNDSVNLQLNALKIYQCLLQFHQDKKDGKPFVSANIDRLNFVKENAVFSEAGTKIYNTFTTEFEAINTKPTATLYSFEIAKELKRLALRYNSNSEDNAFQWHNKKAIDICEKALKNFPNSIGAQKCKVLKQHILKPSITLKTERYLPVNKPALIRIDYKNLDNIDFEIYNISYDQLKKLNALYKPKEREKFISKLDVLNRFSTPLKNEKDYQNHSTEIVLPALDNGFYIIKAQTIDNVYAISHIQVTNFALLEDAQHSQQVYQIIDRNNGAPIVNANVTLTYKSYNSDKTYTKNFNSDSYGKFRFEKNKNYYNTVLAKINYNNQIGIFGDYYINRRYEARENNKIQYNTHIFSDRSIYRPGQTVYFKGIVTQTEYKNTTVSADQKITAALLDVNGQKLSELNFTTNEYGSFHGEFILPNTGLTGNFSIQTSSSVLGTRFYSFSVEEYKRPKFEAEFKPVTETYKVNDSITVNGNAMAFAGSNISDAKVIYRVKRQVRFPSWYYWRRSSYPGSYGSEAQEIAFGETKTDASGNFKITFKAQPDRSALKENLPIFNYEITADVTDINGETRSATTTVRVGYHTLLATVQVPKRIDKSKKQTELKLNTTNLNGQFTSAKGEVKIYKLIAPQYVLRPRPWEASDYKTIPEDEFKNRFPHLSYNNESHIHNWKKGKEVYATSFNTEESKTLILKRTKQWESGNYIVELTTKDKFGQPVKDKAYTFLFSENDKTVADNKLFDISLNAPEYQPKNTAILTFGSAAKNLLVTVEIEKKGKIIQTQIHKLNNSKKQIKLPIDKNDIGGFVVHYSFSAFNSFMSGSIPVNVPYPKTDLQIETTTFRNKLQPGQNETWQFKIKGPKGDKIAAEVLASMYDASLDAFKPHSWNFSPIYRPNYYTSSNKQGSHSFGIAYFSRDNDFKNPPNYPYQNFDKLDWFGFYFGRNIRIRDYKYRKESRAVASPMADRAEIMVDESEALDEVVVTEAPNASLTQTLSGQTAGLKVSSGSGKPDESADLVLRDSLDIKSKSMQVRKNHQETAFFFPELKTDEEGNVSFNFKAPEALTKWKLQLLAHTKTLESAVSQFETVTQKELMVIPNAPRFLRQSDTITISTKIANLTEKQLSGKAQLVLEDVLTGKDMTSELIQSNAIKAFSVDSKGNTNTNWSLNISENIQAIQYKIIAKSENFSDGEQNILPVLTNRMLVTETLPMWVRSNRTKTFTLDKLAATASTNSSKTLKNHKLTLEITSNPAWYAVQALPYLMEYPYECNEQTFSRYYANALAQHITKSNPRIESVLKQWRLRQAQSSESTDALLSNLEKNQELKSLLIEETPWLRDARSESEQKKRIALLFDLNKMNNELQTALRKLNNNQFGSGAWPWFNGGRENRYITQHIVSGFGHLKKLGVISNITEMQMVEKAIAYLDSKFIEEYKNLKKYNPNIDLKKDHLSYTQLHYLYVRSFYPEMKTSNEVSKIMDYYKSQIQKYWLKRSLYAKGLMALTMHRNGDKKTAGKILESLEENSITSEELGMYWKENTASWYWHRAPIETQALMIEAFFEIGASRFVTLSAVEAQKENIKTIDNLKIWLLKNKQTNKWETTKATAEAVYALLLQGSEWLSVTDAIDVTVGNEIISPEKLDDVKVEAGTGYYKTSWNGTEIKPEQSKITLSKKGDGIAWGALYWQYFEDLDKITSAETPLKLKKKLFLKKNTDKGEEISEITENTKLSIGDLVKVRIELRSDRDMEFLHLKDMRAAGFEPINVLSQYKWQDGLGYYESTKDAATNFFIDYLPKGIYVFEYDLRVNNAGNMSNGITTIQSMYAPEFSSHSEGIRVSVKE